MRKVSQFVRYINIQHFCRILHPLEQSTDKKNEMAEPKWLWHPFHFFILPDRKFRIFVAKPYSLRYFNIITKCSEWPTKHNLIIKSETECLRILGLRYYFCGFFNSLELCFHKYPIAFEVSSKPPKLNQKISKKNGTDTLVQVLYFARISSLF